MLRSPRRIDIKRLYRLYALKGGFPGLSEENFSPKVKNPLLYPRKVYGVDQGLLNASRFSLSEGKGRVLENMVYLELRRRNKDIYPFANQAECDFVLVEG